MLRSFLIPTSVAFVVALGGCADVDRDFGTLIGGGDSAVAPAHPLPGKAYFAAADAVPIHAGPSASSPVLGRLGLHERVARSGLEQGYAYITTGNNLRGWVDSGQLQAHLPTPAAPVAHTPAPQQGVIPAPASAATPPAASAASPAAPAVSADATPAPPQPAATPPVTHPAGADASLANTPVRGATPAEPAPEMLNPF